MAKKTNLKAAVSVLIAVLVTFAPTMMGPISAQVRLGNPTDSNQILDCMSVPNASLNVLYLMDVSQSWGDTDPTGRRSPLMASTVSMFNQLGQNINRTVRYSFVQFGTRDDTKVVKQWQKLNNENVQQEIEFVAKASKLENSGGTDWDAGLQKAQDQIIKARAKFPNACFAVVWLTDGSLDLNPDRTIAFVPQDYTSLQNICRSTIGFFRKSNNNVALIGALINSPNATPPYAGGPEAFKWIVTGSGESPVTIGKKDNVFECGLKPGEVPGRFLSRATVSDLSWEFVDLIAELTGLRRADSDANPTISKPVARLQIYVKETERFQKLHVTDSSQIDLCDLGFCKKYSAGGTSSYWIVDIPSSGAGSVSSTEKWKISVTPGTEFKTFVGVQGSYKKLKIRPSADLAFTNIGEGTTVNGTLTLQDEQGVRPESSDLDALNFCITEPESLSDSCVQDTVKKVQDYQAASTDKRFTAQAQFRVPGIEKTFTILYSTPIKVKSSRFFPRLECDQNKTLDGIDYCVLNAIPNRFKKSENILYARVDHGNGTIKVTGFNGNDLPERNSAYEFDSDDQPVSVSEANESSVHFSLSNQKAFAAENAVTGYISYESTGNDRGKDITVKLQKPVIFPIHEDVDWLVVFLLYLSALLIGVGLPYLVLLIMARKQASFFRGSDGVYRYLSVPVKIGANGQMMSPVARDNHQEEDDFEHRDSEVKYELFATPQWRDLSTEQEIPEKCKELTIGQARLQVSSLKYDAFSPVSAFVYAPDSLIFTNQGSDAWELAKERTSVDLNINGLILFEASAIQLEPISQSSIEESDDPFGSSYLQSVTKRVPNNNEITGTLTLVLMGYPNAKNAIEKLAGSIRDRNYQGLVERLEAMRREALSEQSEVTTITPGKSDEISDSHSSSGATDWDDDDVFK